MTCPDMACSASDALIILLPFEYIVEFCIQFGDIWCLFLLMPSTVQSDERYVIPFPVQSEQFHLLLLFYLSGSVHTFLDSQMRLAPFLSLSIWLFIFPYLIHLEEGFLWPNLTVEGSTVFQDQLFNLNIHVTPTAIAKEKWLRLFLILYVGIASMNHELRYSCT